MLQDPFVPLLYCREHWDKSKFLFCFIPLFYKAFPSVLSVFTIQWVLIRNINYQIHCSREGKSYISLNIFIFLITINVLNYNFIYICRRTLLTFSVTTIYFLYFETFLFHMIIFLNCNSICIFRLTLFTVTVKIFFPAFWNLQHFNFFKL